TLTATGDYTVIEIPRPVRKAICETRRHKYSESSSKLKLIANTGLTVISALAAELLAACAAAGVDPEDVFWVLTRFAPVLAARRAGFMEHKHEPVTFALRDAAKDI